MSTNGSLNWPPGIGDQVNSIERVVMASGGEMPPGGVIIDGERARDPRNTDNADTLRAGLILGKVSSSGRFAASIIGTLAEAYDDSSGETSMAVSTATAKELVRRIGNSGTFKITGPPTTAGTVATEAVSYSAINTSTGVITISAASADYIAGSLIQPNDGSENPTAILAGDRLVTDHHGHSVAVPANVYIRGHVAEDGLIDVPDVEVLRLWIRSKLNGGDGVSGERGNFTFADDYAE